MADKQKIISYINNEFARYSKENTTLVDEIPDIDVGTATGALPIDKTATHLNLKNHYSGSGFYHLNNDSFETSDIVFRMNKYDFFFGITEDEMSDIGDMFRDNNQVASMLINQIIQDLNTRQALLKEKELFDVATDNATYNAANIVDLKATAIDAWTETHANKLIDAISTLLVSFNKAVGGGLLNKEGKIQEGSQYKPVLVIPINVWQKLNSKLGIFAPYISYGGSNSEYRTMQVAMFEAITGCKVLIASSIQIKDANINSMDYDNLEEVWNKPAMYLFTFSDNLLNMSGLKRLTKGGLDIYQREDLGDLSFRAKSKSIIVVSNNFANGRIELNGYQN